MRPRRSTVLVAAVIVATSTTAAASAAAKPPDGAVRGSYIVTLRTGEPGAVANEHARRYSAVVEHVYRSALHGYSAVMSAADARRLAADPAVARVVPDGVAHAATQTVPPGIDRIDADVSSTAAGNGKGAVDVDIAIIDTGIDAKHPDLKVVGGVNCVPGSTSYDDLNGHGTHVAGIAAAKDNHVGVVGVAPGARLWAVRVLNSQGSGTFSSIICGIDWVTAHAGTIEVANMSLGGSAAEGSCGDGGMHEAICASVSAGVTYAVAAGNAAADAAFFVPASYDEVITVSALTDFDGVPGGVGTPTCQIGTDDEFAFFSNFGADVDLVAPGVCVLSTWRGGGYRSISGTSMSSPHVAGAAALYRSTHPAATPAQVQAALQGAGTFDWTADPDGVQEPLVIVGGF